MPAAAKPAVRPVQIAMPTDLITTIDRIAAYEMISRSAWLRRTINNAVRYTRWHESLNKGLDKPS
jgi:metal-responsive CopG/Arc/MetJ family transcriptional regulator